MRYIISVLTLLTFLFVACDQTGKKSYSDYFIKTSENFQDLSNSYYLKIYDDYDNNKENDEMESLYRFSYELRRRTGNLIDQFEKNISKKSIQDSLIDFSDFLISSIDIKDNWMIEFINSQLDYMDLDQTNEIYLNEIKTDIKIIEFEILNYLCNVK